MKRIGLVTVGVLGGLAAATTFLCAMPDQRHDGGMRVAKDVPVAVAQRTVVSHAIFVGEPASYGARTSRHAFDAARAGSAVKNQEEDLGWDYVQLRL